MGIKGKRIFFLFLGVIAGKNAMVLASFNDYHTISYHLILFHIPYHSIPFHTSGCGGGALIRCVFAVIMDGGARIQCVQRHELTRLIK